MFDPLRAWLLRWLRVPPQPEPPFGRPESIQVFRAGRNFYRLQLLRWGLGQAAAVVGVVVGLTILYTAETSANVQRARRLAAPQPAPSALSASTNEPAGSQGGQRAGRRRNTPLPERLGSVAAALPSSVFVVFRLVEGVGLLVFLGQLVVTYAVVRLDYELRWYVVTDRSLRIREGLWDVQEMTMSFANLQQVMVSQGPLQRFLGLADVRVQSAGGGGAAPAAHGAQQESMHTGVFHGVEQATEIRDLILDRLRHFRETGLGDPDEHRPAQTAALAATPSVVGGGEDVLSAARELLAEARELRSAVKGGAR